MPAAKAKSNKSKTFGSICNQLAVELTDGRSMKAKMVMGRKKMISLTTMESGFSWRT